MQAWTREAMCIEQGKLCERLAAFCLSLKYLAKLMQTFCRQS